MDIKISWIARGRGHGFTVDGDGTTTFETNERGERENVVFTPHPPATPREIAADELVRLDRHCRVYWGTHGCDLERGHRGTHRCLHDDWSSQTDEDEAPYEDSTGYGWMTWYYGEDAPRIQMKVWIWRHLHPEWLRTWRAKRRWAKIEDAPGESGE